MPFFVNPTRPGQNLADPCSAGGFTVCADALSHALRASGRVYSLRIGEGPLFHRACGAAASNLVRNHVVARVILISTRGAIIIQNQAHQTFQDRFRRPPKAAPDCQGCLEGAMCAKEGMIIVQTAAKTWACRRWIKMSIGVAIRFKFHGTSWHIRKGFL